MANRIIIKYRKNPDIPLHLNNTFKDDEDYIISFHEFINFILDRAAEGWYDRHWEPQHRLCQPCAVKYTFYGKHQTLDQDAQHVLGVSGVTERTNLTWNFKASHKISTNSFVREVFKTISAKQRSKLKQMYLLDYKLFQYEIHPLLT